MFLTCTLTLPWAVVFHPGLCEVDCLKRSLNECLSYLIWIWKLILTYLYVFTDSLGNMNGLGLQEVILRTWRHLQRGYIIVTGTCFMLSLKHFHAVSWYHSSIFMLSSVVSVNHSHDLFHGIIEAFTCHFIISLKHSHAMFHGITEACSCCALNASDSYNLFTAPPGPSSELHSTL